MRREDLRIPLDEWQARALRKNVSLLAGSVVALAQRAADGVDHPTKAPTLLATVLLRTAREASQKLEKVPPNHLLHLHYFLEQAAYYVRFVERARTTETPWSLIESMEECLGRLIGGNGHFLIRPKWDYQYFLYDDLVREFRLGLESFFGEDPERDEVFQEKVYTICFPRTERLNVCQHVLMAHEVGHVVWLDWWWNAKAEPQPVNGETAEPLSEYKSVQDELAGPVCKARGLKYPPPESPLDPGRSEVEAALREALELFESGMRELVADALAIHAFGMAGTLALLDIASRKPLDEAPRKAAGYPPWRYRIELALKAVEPGSFELGGDPMQSWIQEATKIFPNGGALKQLSTDPFTAAVYEVVSKRYQGTVDRILASLAGETKYLLRDRSAFVMDLVERLRNGVPPNEFGKWPNVSPAELPDIMNAAWIRRIELVASGASAEDLESLSLLVLKAAESSFFVRHFSKDLG